MYKYDANNNNNMQTIGIFIVKNEYMDKLGKQQAQICDKLNAFN